MHGLKVCGVPEQLVQQVKATLSAVLWIGEVRFVQNVKDNAEIEDFKAIEIISGEFCSCSRDGLLCEQSFSFQISKSCSKP